MTKNNNIAVLITCYNRIDYTIRCLNNVLQLNSNIDMYLVDDNSTDGTALQVSKEFPMVNIIKGTGNLFWNRGMHLAWLHASKYDYDFYIWLNDDVVLYNNAFEELLKCSKFHNNEAIVSGIIESQDKSEILYGGSNKYGIIKPNGEMNPIKNLNGNVVLVPRYVFKKLGNLDPVFHHDLGDVDYGLRAQKLNIDVFTTRVAIAAGEKNYICRVRKNNSNLINRFKVLYSPLGSHPAINFYYRIKHKGIINAIVYYFYLHLINVLPDRIVELIFKNKYNPQI